MESDKGEKLGCRIFLVGTLICFVLGVAGLVLPALSFARKRATRTQCVRHLKQVELEALIWAHDESNFMPRTFLEFSDHFASPAALICPAAPNARQETERLQSWKDFDERRSSYEILHPGIASSNEHTLFLRCKVHDMFAYVNNEATSRYDLTNGIAGPQYEVPSDPARTNHSR